MKPTITASFMGTTLILASGLTSLFPKTTIRRAISHPTPPDCPFSGSFSSFSIRFPPESHPQSVTSADFDQDTFEDLAVALRESTTTGGMVSVLINDKNGGFHTAVSYPTGGNEPVFVIARDFDGLDGPDLALVNQATPNMAVLLNSGSGTFPMCMPTFTHTTGIAPHGIAAGNFNSGGVTDLAIAYIGFPPLVPGAIQVFLGAGDGTFSALMAKGAGDQPHAVVAAQFTSSKDNIPDLLVANGGNSDTQASLLVGVGDGTFTGPNCPTQCPTTGQKPVNLTVGDFGNMEQDFASANLKDSQGSATVGIGSGMGTFSPLQTLQTGNMNCSMGDETASDVAVGDIDNDGFKELVVTNFCQSSVSIFSNLGDGSGEFCSTAKTLLLSGSKGPRSVALFHLKHDGKLAIAVANDIDNSVTIITLN